MMEHAQSIMGTHRKNPPLHFWGRRRIVQLKEWFSFSPDGFVVVVVNQIARIRGK